MIVEQLVNKNQFVIYDEGRIYFQSYQSLIAYIDIYGDLTLYQDWNYSKTTMKHLKIFLINNIWQGKSLIDWDKPFKKELIKLIKNGTIIKGY